MSLRNLPLKEKIAFPYMKILPNRVQRQHYHQKHSGITQRWQQCVHIRVQFSINATTSGSSLFVPIMVPLKIIRGTPCSGFNSHYRSIHCGSTGGSALPCPPHPGSQDAGAATIWSPPTTITEEKQWTLNASIRKSHLSAHVWLARARHMTQPHLKDGSIFTHRKGRRYWTVMPLKTGIFFFLISLSNLAHLA